MQIQYFRFWQTHPVLNLIYQGSTSGKLRYAVKKNARKMQDHHEDIIEWIRGDKMDAGWEGDKIPFEDKGFIDRFEKYLLDTRGEFEPHYFTEDLMQYADGITGDQENVVSWLFEENKPSPENKEVAETDEG